MGQTKARRAGKKFFLGLVLLGVTGLIACAVAQEPGAGLPVLPPVPDPPPPSNLPALDPAAPVPAPSAREKQLADELGVPPPTPAPVDASGSDLLLVPASAVVTNQNPPVGQVLPPAPPLSGADKLPAPAAPDLPPLGGSDAPKPPTPIDTNSKPKPPMLPEPVAPKPTAPVKSDLPPVLPKPVAVPPAVAPTSTPDNKPPAFQPLKKDVPQQPSKSAYQPPALNSDPVAVPVPKPAALPRSVAQRPVVVIEHSGPVEARVGEVVKYEITVRNDGDAASGTFNVFGIVPGSAEVVEVGAKATVINQRVSWSIADLAPGKAERLTLILKALRMGELRVEALAVIPLAQKTVSTKVSGLEMHLRVDTPPQVTAGQKVPLKISITNKGAAAQPGVLLTMQIPDGLRHAEGKEIVADLPPIEPGATRAIDVKLESVKAGRFPVAVGLSYSGADLAKKEVAVDVQEAPGLVLKKVGLPVLMRGRMSEYRVEVLNQGDRDAQNVILTEHLPEGVDFVEASDNGVYNPQTRSVQWVLGAVKPGNARAVGLRIIGQRPGEVVNQVSAESMGGVQVGLTARLVIQQPTSTPAPAGPFGFLKNQ
jgi:uncharacterized repeat protein (TIGR01451 family)